MIFKYRKPLSPDQERLRWQLGRCTSVREKWYALETAILVRKNLPLHPKLPLRGILPNEVRSAANGGVTFILTRPLTIDFYTSGVFLQNLILLTGFEPVSAMGSCITSLPGPVGCLRPDPTVRSDYTAFTGEYLAQIFNTSVE